MKIQSISDTLETQNDTSAQIPVKICMHVLGMVRVDGRVMCEASAFVEAGFEVTIVDVESEGTRPVEEDIHGIGVQHMIMPSWFISTRFKPWFLVKAVQVIIRGIVRLLRTKADIYHAHDVMALPACYVAARLRRKPLIFDAHELPLSDPVFILWRKLSALSARLLTAIVAGCAGVITVSPPIAEEMRKRYHIPQVTLIRNVPPYRVVAKSDRLRQHLVLGSEVRIALYQGNLQHNRGLDRLIRAAAFLEPDIVIVMMGQGPKGIQAKLEALIAREGVSDRVRIIPEVPYEELLDWTSSADIGLIVYSSDYSLNVQMCLPNKLFEYLMSGLPVLTSELEAITEVVKTCDVGQIVPSLAPSDIGAAINAMLVDTAALARMRNNALEAARHEFHWENESQKLIQLYHAVLTR
jgi:glycosyltransferase involved in cell wall biosynthesis